MRLLLLLLPWLELFTLIQLGVETSALTALGWVLLTLVLGGLLLRKQGEGMLRRLRETQQGFVINPGWLVDDMAMGLAAVLLMVPGLITDALAVLVMIGPLRRRLARALGGRRPRREAPGDSPQDATTLEGDYRRLDD
jgi:UPF0716 protein FxsA